MPPHRCIVVPAGEAHKTLETCATVWGELSAAGADRHSALLCVGGGVVCDLGGFCAATYKRGIACLLAPTTSLAMVDAAIGGKTGIDFQGFKNQIGTFTQPEGVFIWPAFLQTLPPRETRAGLAEAIKHVLIADAPGWSRWQTALLAGTLPPWEAVIPEAVQIKAAIVARDPREAGERKALNFGHTVGHAIESHLLEAGTPLLHGECVALGMIAEMAIARDLGLVAAETCESVSVALADMFSGIAIAAIALPNELLHWAWQDKKNRNGSIRCALPNGLGACRWDVAVSVEQLAAGLDWCRKKMAETLL